MAFSRMNKVKKEAAPAPPPPPKPAPTSDDEDDDMPPLLADPRNDNGAAAEEARMLDLRKAEEESRAKAVAEAKRAYEEKKRKEQAARRASAEEEARRRASAADESRRKASEDEAAQRRRVQAAAASASVPSPVMARGTAPPLSVGSTVRLEGLRAAPQLNGQRAVCKRLDAETGRWAVRLASGEEKSVKADNLVVEDASVSNSREAKEAARSAIEEEKARQARIARSREEAAKRAGGGKAPAGGGFGGGGFGGSANAKGAEEPRKGFAWAKKSSPQAPSQAYGFGQNFTGLGGMRSDGLPGHDDCEMAISAMISRSSQGMKEGLRQLGLPDYPLDFVPGQKLKLCGHDVREAINSMIHHWMEEEQEQFYKDLRKVKQIVEDPLYTEDDKSMFAAEEVEWEEVKSSDGKKMFRRKKRDGEGAPHLSQPERRDESDEEVTDVRGTRDGLKEAWGAPAASSPPPARPVPSRGAVISDPDSSGPIIEELPDDYEEPPKKAAVAQRPAPSPAPAAAKQQQRSSPPPAAARPAPARAEVARPQAPTRQAPESDEESDEVEDVDDEEEVVGKQYEEDDYYALLGAEPEASLQELRTKFRQLVIAKHPEKGGDPVEFALLSKAYGVLSDSAQRKQYDERRAAARKPAPARAPPQRAAPAPAPKAAGGPRVRTFVD